jgi:glycine cleavage system H protein
MTGTRFAKSHEWIREEGGIATIGITKYAAGQLGDVVFVEMPKPGRSLEAGAEVAVVESVKAASEIYAPAAGEVTEVNDAIEGDPARVNADPEGEGWIFKMRLTSGKELGNLMTKEQYADFVKGL